MEGITNSTQRDQDIRAISVLNNLLNSTVDTNPPNEKEKREYVFNKTERGVIRKKVMELIKEL